MDQRSDTCHLHLTVLTQAVTQATDTLDALVATEPFDSAAYVRVVSALRRVNEHARHQGLGERWAGIVGTQQG